MTAADRQLREHADAAGKRLVHLHGLARKTEVAERAILSGAIDRFEAVQRELQQIGTRVHTDDAAGRRYQDLIMERGQLNTVIAQARRNLGE